MHKSPRLAVLGGHVLQGKGFERTDLLISEGTITRVGPVRPLPNDCVLDATGCRVVPGFIDLHLHGGNGADFTDGTAAAAKRILAFHARHGTTRSVGSLVPLAPDRMSKVVDTLARASVSGLLGLHLEGPFVARSKAGALSPDHLRGPDLEGFSRLVGDHEEAIRIVTVAPELPQAESLIAAIRAIGAVAAIGHSDAPYEQTLAAISDGAKHITHLFNAMRGLHHRDPGVVGAALASETVSLELIADGRHLHPGTLRWVIGDLAARGQLARLCLVTDAMRATGSPDGDYALGDESVTVSDGVARLADGSLAGSLLTLDRALQIAMEASGQPLEEAVQWVTANPARVLGECDRLGSLQPGFLGDLVLLDDEGRVRTTVREGRTLFEAGDHA